MSEPAKDLGWHAISGEHLLEAMRRCADGEDPDLVYAELWANARPVTDDAAKVADIRNRRERGTTPRPEDVEFLLAALERLDHDRTLFVGALAHANERLQRCEDALSEVGESIEAFLLGRIGWKDCLAEIQNTREDLAGLPDQAQRQEPSRAWNSEQALRASVEAAQPVPGDNHEDWCPTCQHVCSHRVVGGVCIHCGD
jgi:hypothetical protein